MSSFTRGMRLGAGLVALGFGTFRLANGQNGLMTSASLTTGASMLLGGLNVGRPFRRGAQVAQMARSVGRAAKVVAHRSQS